MTTDSTDIQLEINPSRAGSFDAVEFSPDGEYLIGSYTMFKPSLPSSHLNFQERDTHDDAPQNPSTPSSRVHLTLEEPEIELDGAVVQSWNHDDLENAHSLLTTAITTSQTSFPHLFASRALVRARLRLWDEALADADKAINSQPSVIAFIVQSLARDGKGEREDNLQSGENSEHVELTLDFKQRLSDRIESFGDTAVDSSKYGAAIDHYSTALSLTSSPQVILIKRSKAWLATGSWQQALDDANQAISLDPSSPWGYEMKHAALHQSKNYDDAIIAFETMLMKLAESRDPDVQRRAGQYVKPQRTRKTIVKIVERTLLRLPHVLIHTAIGRPYKRDELVSSFKFLPIFKKLVSSMTTCIDSPQIKREVQEYFRYVMLSHRWEDNEPLFQQVMHTSVYDLRSSPTHDKLQTFCKIARNSGFHWAWSDTCCINKDIHGVLQETLVAMFTWYQNAAMVIVFLRGVRPSSPSGALATSIWNTRGWTLQEYIAAKAVRFYTEDWTLYRDLVTENHKESREIMEEMEQITGITAQQLMALRPGINNIREKLRLASGRQTTRVEDAAYSLLGIFATVGIIVNYGEREISLGRLLANVVTRSGDISVLAWTGNPNPFNTCLPARITVFNEPATLHLPPPIPDSNMEQFISRLPSFNLDDALRLYDRLNQLSAPHFSDCRLTLPCIAIQLPPFSSHRTRSGRVYRTDTIPFGRIEVRTRHNLSGMGSLYLIQPWIDSLMGQGDMHGGMIVEDDGPPPSPDTDDEDDVPPPSRDLSDEAFSEEELDDDLDNDSLASLPYGPESLTISTHPLAGPVDRETGARRLVVRLKQPFGALLFRKASTRQRDGAMNCKRVAADALITVQFQEGFSLADILRDVRELGVL